MITDTHKAIADLVIEELRRAREAHGEYFASALEGYGVLAEEIQEAQDELSDIIHTRERLLRNIRYGKDHLYTAGKTDAMRCRSRGLPSTLAAS